MRPLTDTERKARINVIKDHEMHYCICKHHGYDIMFWSNRSQTRESQLLMVEPSVICDLLTHLDHFARPLMEYLLAENHGTHRSLLENIWIGNFQASASTARAIGKFLSGRSEEQLESYHQKLMDGTPWYPAHRERCLNTGTTRNEHASRIRSPETRRNLSHFLLQCGGFHMDREKTFKDGCNPRPPGRLAVQPNTGPETCDLYDLGARVVTLEED